MKYIILLTTFLSCFYGCIRPCIEPRGIEGAGLTIKFFHTANDQYFYTENPNLSPFRLDSLKILDSRGKLLNTPTGIDQDHRNPLRKIYTVGIYPIFIPSDDEEAFNSEQSKWIYIYYNRTTSDTLKLVYKARKEKCANKYEYLKAYHREQLVGEIYNSYHENLEFTLNH
ncbi:MAG: hypothetical protein EOO10_08485 [Chitinophagaceae bacterium]|nr:hypothetical protein [Flavisolibacter longurius]RYZ28750.1 MAG: hypothetical protein EOO10_08485 [Chitinophagaceae bacterium]